MTDIQMAAAPNLTIGALSSATSVPVDTLRTWERRYGFPKPISRTEGSHRRYAAQTVDEVRLIVRALQLGHRPSTVVGRASSELEHLIAIAEGETPKASGGEVDTVEEWLALTAQLDAELLGREFEERLSERSVLDFLEGCLSPYLRELGLRWTRGQVRISHEHFASERITDFLQQRWRPLSEALPKDAASVVIATPPGERHVLGLHMAAWILALAGLRVVFLGADTPAGEVAFTACEHQAQAVVLSVSCAYRGDLRGEVQSLASSLPPDVAIAVGGGGARLRSRTAQVLNGFRDLQSWAIDRSRPHRP